jgi:mannose/fructose/N-acetylgalactosamine-specific phosphotransferase system component IIC
VELKRSNEEFGMQISEFRIRHSAIRIAMSLFAYAALLCLAGAVVLLDKWTFGEFGISQPIVSCPLLGILFGDVGTGMFLGTALQLVWIESLPLGGEKPLDYQSAGVVGITSFLLARRAWSGQPSLAWFGLEHRVLFACLILAALGTIVGQYADDRLRRVNDGIYHLGSRATRARGVFGAHLLAFLPALLRGALTTGFFLVLMWLALPLMSRLPDFTRDELLLCPLAIGIAGLVKLFYRRERVPLFAAGMIVSGVLWVLWK